MEKALLVIPHWTSQSWFPVLLSLLISLPVRIPRHKDALTLPHSGQLHPLGTVSLVGVLVSGDVSKARAFQKTLSTQSSSHGDPELKNNTPWHGGNGVIGLFHGRIIRYKPMLNYLQYLKRLGKSYSVINTHKSILIQTLKLLKNSWCDNPFYISRFMKGLLNIQPPTP